VRRRRVSEVEANDLARDHAQTGVFSVLVAEVEQQLQAEADPQERPAGGNGFDDRRDQFLLAKVGDGVGESTDTRQDHLGGSLDLIGRGNDARIGSHALEGLLNAAKIAHAVVNDGYHVRTIYYGTGGHPAGQSEDYRVGFGPA